MDENLETILDSLPEKRSSSRLEPYGDLIRELLRRHRTYREIAFVLFDRFQLHASISTIHDFVQRWSTATGKIVKSGPQKTRKEPTNISAKVPVPAAENSGISVDLQKRIAALKSRPIPGTEVKIFHYDPEQPLQISSPQSEKKRGE